MPLQTSQILSNRYRIVKLLGQGGFGAVYRAWDMNLNRPCAIKENLDTSPEAQRQFLREASVLANLSHPNLPRVTDHFILLDQGQYLVMDFIEGEDLASMVSQQGALPIEQSIEWITQVADALSYLHSRQPPVIHRDIKPANIRITLDNRAVLVDFGLVKVSAPHVKTTLGARAVTPGYAPPEQYGTGHTDSRTDIYALGATLYSVLTRQEPMESVQRVAGRQMPSAHILNPKIPIHISHAIDRAMALDPDQRFQNAIEFQRALIQPVQSPSQELIDRRVEHKVAPTMVIAPPKEKQVPPQYSQEVELMQQRIKPFSKAGVIAGALLGFFLLAVTMGILLSRFIGLFPSSADKTATHLALIGIQNQTTTAIARNVAIEKTNTPQNSPTPVDTPKPSPTTIKFDATEQAWSLRAGIHSVTVVRTLVFGPVNGKIEHNPGESTVKNFASNVSLRDFIIEARFTNPYPISAGGWDYGFQFRRVDSENQYRLIILSDETWTLNLWKDGKSQTVASGDLGNLNTQENGSNIIQLFCQGSNGYFYLNNEFIAKLDVSGLTSAGGIYVATGFFENNEIAGKSTLFQDFTIWSIP